MGINILIKGLTFFTTWSLCMYWSFTAGPSNYDKMLEEQQNFYEGTNSDLEHRCQVADDQPRMRIKRIEKDGNHGNFLQFELIETLPTGQRNKARFRDSLHCVPICEDSDKIVLLTHLISLKDHLRSLKLKRTVPRMADVNLRWMELLNTLQRNLNHPQIKTIVLLTESRSVAEYVLTLDLDNSHKLLIQNINKELSTPDAFDHTTKCFQGQTVAIVNQDIIFGDGWQNLDYEYLKTHRHAYALTRHHSLLNPECIGNPSLGICMKEYGNAHDGFVLHVKERIHKTQFISLEKHLYNIRGMENVVIWVLRNKLGYKVSNPCSLLHLHHEHCISIRNTLGFHKKFGNESVWATAPFTDTLY
eukprot:TCONS_00067606-protein